ncbi:PDZ domain-containing protein [Aurantiacibacter odishensis]|uniref:PDZ domain-containing protein n=1 Tax=Aurantiacibacter odishensis TaxID=1155476 RepID=UPI0013C4ECA3|nr:M48 family metallopeptidase [Aurantiacibacter odishensis]
MKCLLAMLLLLLPAASFAQSSEELAEQDLRLARIADAMLVGNAKLCRQTMPVTGIILHSADQYGDGAQALFAGGPLAIAEVVSGSAADQAGLRAGDTIAAINGTPVSHLSPQGEDHLRELAFFLLADTIENEPIALTVVRDDEVLMTNFSAPNGCRSLVEILVADGPKALSDGRVIQLQYDFATSLTDEQMAVVLAHELAHTVLEHRRRKEALGIDNGSIMRHLGRNQQVNRRAEVEADRLSAHLLANAGYDPMLVPQFWQSPEGIRAGGGSMPSFVYPSQSARAEIVEREIAMFLPSRRGPSWPGHLLELRDRSLAAD